VVGAHQTTGPIRLTKTDCDHYIKVIQALGLTEEEKMYDNPFPLQKPKDRYSRDFFFLNKSFSVCQEVFSDAAILAEKPEGGIWNRFYETMYHALQRNN